MRERGVMEGKEVEEAEGAVGAEDGVSVVGSAGSSVWRRLDKRPDGKPNMRARQVNSLHAKCSRAGSEGEGKTARAGRRLRQHGSDSDWEAEIAGLAYSHPQLRATRRS